MLICYVDTTAANLHNEESIPSASLPGNPISSDLHTPWEIVLPCWSKHEVHHQLHTYVCHMCDTYSA